MENDNCGHLAHDSEDFMMLVYLFVREVPQYLTATNKQGLIDKFLKRAAKSASACRVSCS
jgi:hypothetical protein